MFASDLDDDTNPQPRQSRINPRAAEQRLLGRSTIWRRLKAPLVAILLLAAAAMWAQGYLDALVARWWHSAKAELPAAREARTSPIVLDEPRPKREPAAAAPPLPDDAGRHGSDPAAPVRGRPPAVRVSWGTKFDPPPDMAWFQDGRRPHLAPGCALRPGGHDIPATLLNDIESEIGGQVVAEVAEDVFDFDGLNPDPIVPLGSRLVGYFGASQDGIGGNGKLRFQSRRLGIVWTQLLMTDGATVDLGQSLGQDPAGAMGVGGEVTARWGELLAVAALSTIFDGIGRGTVTGNDPSLLNDFQRSGGRNIGELGNDVTRRVLDWEPRIHIPAGTMIRITPQQTIQVCDPAATRAG